MAVRLIESFIDAVERDPEGIATIDHDGRTWSRTRLLREAVRLAQGLAEDVDPDATVMIHGPSGGGFWAALLAGFASGRAVLPVGSESTDEERERLVAAHAVGAILETSASEAWSSPPDGVVALGVEHEREGRVGDLPGRASACSLLLRSSGTTSRPAVARRSAAALDRVATVLVDRLAIDASDLVHVALPMQHAYGMEHGVLAPIAAGCRVRWTRGLDPMRGAEALAPGTTVLPTVPAILDGLARCSNAGSSLRLVYTAGSPLPRPTAERFEAAWNATPGDLYGMTEVGTIAFGFGPRLTPVDGVEVRVSEAGELLVRSDAMFDGYAVDAGGRLDPGRRIDGFLRTGDLGDLDPAGALRITGRAKVQFDVGGLKVNPEEVEAVLGAHPDVADVAIAPLRLNETVTRVRALVVIRDGGDPARTIEALRARSLDALAAHQRPRSIDVVSTLPRTATGKLRRGLLDSV